MGPREPHEVQQGQLQDPVLGSTPGINTGRAPNGLRAALSSFKDLEVLADIPLQPRRPALSWAPSKAAWPSGRGR